MSRRVLPVENSPRIKCDARIVKWHSCASSEPSDEVVHLQIGNRSWVHSEHMGLDRFAAVRNGSISVSAGMLATADVLLKRGAWSEAVQHAKIALTKPVLYGGSYVSLPSARPPRVDRRGSTASRFARLGWLRLSSMHRASTADVEQLVFFASSVDLHRTDSTLLKHYAKQLQSRAQLWLLLLTTEAAPAFDPRGRPLDASMRQHPTFLWSERALQKELPHLARAVHGSLLSMAREPISNHAR